MKQLAKLTLWAGLALALIAPVSAQIYSAQTISAAPATIAASTTATVTNGVCDIREQDEVGIQVDFNATGASVSNLVLVFANSVDGSTYSTTAGSQHTWTVIHNGTTMVSETTNITVKGYGYLKLLTAQNTHGTQSVSNLLVKYAIKKPLAR